MNSSPVSSDRLVHKLSDPALTASLSHFVRARVPEAAVEDIVQSTLTEALDAEQHPEEDEDIVRWVHGICRHKVVDWFRRARREVPRDLESPEDGPVAAAESAPQSALDLLRWAQKELPAGEENQRTLEWMLREGAGEKLETIAAEANVPAPRVRQRVSRLRRYYKARWAAQAAAFAALLLVAIAIALALRHKEEVVAPAPGPSLSPSSLVPPPLPTAPESLPPESPALSAPPPEPSPLDTSKVDSQLKYPAKPQSTNPSFPAPVPTTSAMPAPIKPSKKPPGKASPPSSDSWPASNDTK
jgi:DNA-directed RNA polymerase specialized sigma24 family protein